MRECMLKKTYFIDHIFMCENNVIYVTDLLLQPVLKGHSNPHWRERVSYCLNAQSIQKKTVEEYEQFVC